MKCHTSVYGFIGFLSIINTFSNVVKIRDTLTVAVRTTFSIDMSIILKRQWYFL